jgi:flagellar hook-length control protein FliK
MPSTELLLPATKPTTAAVSNSAAKPAQPTTSSVATPSKGNSSRNREATASSNNGQKKIAREHDHSKGELKNSSPNSPTNDVTQKASGSDARVKETTGNESQLGAESSIDNRSDFMTTLAAVIDESNATDSLSVSTATANSLPMSIIGPLPSSSEGNVLVASGNNSANSNATSNASVVDNVLLGMQLANVPTPTAGDISSDVSFKALATRQSSTIDSATVATSLKPSDAALVQVQAKDPVGTELLATVESQLSAKSDQELASSSQQSNGVSIHLQQKSESGMTPMLAKTHDALEARVGTPRWSDEIAARVNLMSQRDVHAASLRLSPEHLGPLEIQITVQNDKTSVWFGAAHADTRAALEQAMPRLRELLSSQGLVLSDSGVFREPPRDRTLSYPFDKSSPNTISEDSASIDATVRVSRSLLDAYA